MNGEHCCNCNTATKKQTIETNNNMKTKTTTAATTSSFTFSAAAMAMITGEVSVKATKALAGESAQMIGEQVLSDLIKGGKMPILAAPESVTDELAKTTLASADIAMRNAILATSSIQKAQTAAASTWHKLGLTKQEASLRIDALCHHLQEQGHQVPSPRSIKSRALEAAGYAKDEAKVKARGARKGGKIITPVDRVIACARHHAKGDAAVLKLLKAAIAKLGAAE